MLGPNGLPAQPLPVRRAGTGYQGFVSELALRGPPLGVGKGDRVATIAPNTHAQLEAFYAVPQLDGVRDQLPGLRRSFSRQVKSSAAA